MAVEAKQKYQPGELRQLRRKQKAKDGSDIPCGTVLRITSVRQEQRPGTVRYVYTLIPLATAAKSTTKMQRIVEMPQRQLKQNSRKVNELVAHE